MDLKQLLVDSKTTWVEFPGLEGFEVELANLSRKELVNLRKRCTTNKFNRKTRGFEETLDEEKFVKEFTSANPAVELTLVPHTENVDARIILKDELNENEQYIDMWHEDYLLAMPYDHILALKDSVTIQQLDGLPFIQRTPCSAWDHLQDTLAISGVSLDVRAKITTIDYALGLVHAGLGCAFLPAHSEIIKRSDVVFRPIVGLQSTREIVLAYTTSSKAINNLKRLARKHAH